MRTWLTRAAAALAVAGFALLAGCGGPIDPDRPPKYDYEFDPPAGGDIIPKPNRV